MERDPNVHKCFMPRNVHDPPEFIPKFKRVVFGTIAGTFATILVHPIDLVKVRIITYSERLSYHRMAKRIVKFQGIRCFFSGLSAGVLRQATNTSVRLSVYNVLYDRHKKKHNKPPSDIEKVQIGVIAGAIGAFCGSPSEVVLVRMMVQSAPRAFNKCPDLAALIKKPYEGPTDAINRIIREEGVRTLWRAGTHTIARSMVLSAVQIGVYAKIRDYLLKHDVTRGLRLHVLTAMTSSLLAGIITLPIDIVKTRYQMRRYGVTKMELWNILRTKRSVKWLLTIPFPPYYARMAIHTTLSYIFIGNLNALYYKYSTSKTKKDTK